MVAAPNSQKSDGVLSQDLGHHFSRSSRKRVPNVMKDYYRFLTIPGMGCFAGGFPYSGYFPFEQLEISTKAPHSVDSGRNDGGKSVWPLRLEQTVLQANPFQKIDLRTALQYGTSQGYPALYALLKKWVNTAFHPNIPYKGGADVIITGGAADGLSKLYDILFNEWDVEVNARKDREGLIVEEYVYPPPIAQVKHKDINIVPARTDEEGMQVDGPGGLLEILQLWDYSQGKRPHVLYLIPTGGNPTSGVLSLPRRRRIYEVCSEFDVLIVEDDPYWNLFYSSAQSLSKKYRDEPVSANFPTNPNHNYCVDSLKGSTTGFSFTDQLIPSFLQIDTDGRVIRLDTFSKTIAPGCRLGWITAQPGVCEQLFRLTDATSQPPSGITQAIVAKLLVGECSASQANHNNSQTTESAMSWGIDGWIRHLKGLRDSYQARMITMATIFEQNRFLKTSSRNCEMFSFKWPMGGMFLWAKLLLENHPLKDLVDTKRLMLALWILCTQEPYRVLVVPGKDFAATDAIRNSNSCTYFRLSFAGVDESVLIKKSHAFVEACQQFWSICNIEDVNCILQEEDAMRANLAMNGVEEEIERLVIDEV